MINHYPVIGRYIRDQDVANNEKIAVLGWEVAEDLFGSENPVGKAMRVVIGGRSLSLTVVGVMEAKGQVMMANYDNRIYVPVTMLLNRGLNSRYVDGYSIWPLPGCSQIGVEEVEAFMTRMLGIPTGSGL